MSRDDHLLKKYKSIVCTADIPRERTLFSLGSLAVNIAAGNINGVESGRLVQIVGKQSSGKSTLALSIASQYQLKTHESVLYVDFERSFDAKYARSCGVTLSDMFLVRADTTEQGLNIVEEAIRTGIKLVIIDSIAAAMPSSEINKDYDDSPKMASNAGLITRFCNRIIPLLDNNNAALFVLNQNRKNFSTLSPETEIPFGGMALQYATSLSLQVARIKTEEEKQTTQIIVKKNKTSAPQGRAEITIQYGHGIRHDLDILNLAIERDIIKKNGAWFTYNDIKVQGLDKASIEFPLDKILCAIMESGV